MVMVSPAAASPSSASGSTSKAASSNKASSKQSSAAATDVSIRLWPPGSRTRSHVAERMAENLKSLSAFYQRLEPDEAVRIAGLVEDCAFEQGQQEDREASRVSDNRNNGSSAVRVYAKQASRMMLEVLKTGKIPEADKISKDAEIPDGNADAEEEKEASSVTTAMAVASVEDTAVSTAVPAQQADTELFDISGGERKVLDMEMVEQVFRPLADSKGGYTKVRLSNWGFTKEAASYAGNLLFKFKDELVSADLSDIVAGRPEGEALEVMTIFSAALEGSVLSSLNLSNNALGEKGVRAFGLLLKSQKKLQELYLENNGISPDAAKVVAELVTSSNLRTLHFHNNMTGDGGADWLAKLVTQATGLEDFKLSSSRVGSKGAVALSRALQRCPRLKKLDLRDNMFGSAADSLAEALKNKSMLAELYLADLGLGDEGVVEVLNALLTSASKLEVLDLGNNDLTVSCAPYLVEFLETKPALKKLSLAENELKDKGVILVAKALKQNHEELEELDLTLNDFGSEGAVAAAKAVANKPRFKRLVLESNHISCKGLAEVEAELEKGIGKSVLEPLEDNDDDLADDDDLEVEDEEEANEETGDSEEVQKEVNALSI